jgi:hypothetical protein
MRVISALFKACYCCENEVDYSFRAPNFLLALAEFVAETITLYLQTSILPTKLFIKASNYYEVVQQALRSSDYCFANI